MTSKIELQQIEYIFDDKNKFIIKPIEFYYTNSLPEEKTRHVIIFYEFTYINNDNKISSIISLYLSDGKSNGFRGNLLLPFLCIESKNDKITEDDFCPTKSKKTQGLLYKLKSCHDMNTHTLFTDIIKNIKSEHTDYETTKEYTDLMKYKPKGMGIFTVLQRIDSFILFFLNMVNAKIKYVYDNKDYNINIFQPILETIQPLQYNTDYDPQIVYNRDNKYDEYVFYLSNLKFPKYMIKKFVEIYEKIVKDDKINITYINKDLNNPIDFKPIDVTELNMKIKVCNENNIDQLYYNNYKIFNEISAHFLSLYELYSKDNPITKYIDKAQYCYTLNSSFKMFSITCAYKQKYLKYKQKYMKLKQSLN